MMKTEIEPVDVRYTPAVTKLCAKVGLPDETAAHLRHHLGNSQQSMRSIATQKVEAKRRLYSLRAEKHALQSQIPEAFKTLATASMIVKTRRAQLSVAHLRRVGLIYGFREEARIVLRCTVKLPVPKTRACPTDIVALCTQDICDLTCGVQAWAVREHFAARRIRALTDQCATNARHLTRARQVYIKLKKSLKGQRVAANAFAHALHTLLRTT